MIGLLIADDEMLERKVLYKTLQKNLGDRCTIYEAENGRKVLELFEANDIRILILDIEMPGINGIEAAERIRQKDKDCCIIFLTAFDEFAYARKAITVRAMDYLLKPYDETELLLLLEEAIRQAEEQAAPEKPAAAAAAGAVPERPAAAAAVGAAPEKPAAAADAPEGPAVSAVEGSASEGPERQEDGAGRAVSGGDMSFRGADMPQEGSEDFENSRLWKVRDMIDRYVRENYMYDISMQDLARSMNYSEAYFCKLFKQCFGKNFTSFLTEYRVGVAKSMMEQPTVNIKEIGRAVGYGDPNYFAKVFRRVTGQSPSDYRTELFRQ